MSTYGITQRMRDDLELAAQTLRRYEALHRAKGTPESAEKAEVNAALAKRFESTVRVFDGTSLAISPKLRETAQALLDKLDGRRSFGAQLLAAEFADERRALRAALAAPERPQPAGDAAMPPLPKPLAVGVWGYVEPTTFTADQMKAYAMAATASLHESLRSMRCALIEMELELAERDARIADMRKEWGAEVAALQAEGAKSERRAIMFGDALHRHILAMRAAFVAWHRAGPAESMAWVINTLAGPGHLPSDSDIALGAQALFDKEVAEQEAFRAAHPGPVVVASGAAEVCSEAVRSSDARIAELEAQRVPDGWVAVPKDPAKFPQEVDRMIDAFERLSGRGRFDCYRDMIAAVSKPAGAAEQAMRDAMQLPDLLAASERMEPGDLE